MKMIIIYDLYPLVIFVCLFVLRFIYLLCLCWVIVAVHRFSLVLMKGYYPLLQLPGFSLPWLLLLQSTGPRHVASVMAAHGLSSCDT